MSSQLKVISLDDRRKAKAWLGKDAYPSVLDDKDLDDVGVSVKDTHSTDIYIRMMPILSQLKEDINKLKSDTDDFDIWSNERVLLPWMSATNNKASDLKDHELNDENTNLISITRFGCLVCGYVFAFSSLSLCISFIFNIHLMMPVVSILFAFSSFIFYLMFKEIDK